MNNDLNEKWVNLEDVAEHLSLSKVLSELG